MGGARSGRWGGRPVVEVCRSVTIGSLTAGRRIEPGDCLRANIEWGDGFALECGIRVEPEGDKALAVLFYGGRRQDVPLVSRAMRFGGRRWWFLCPVYLDPVGALYLPAPASAFASRAAHRLGYRSQRVDRAGRLARRIIALQRALGDDGGYLLGPAPDKPLWMRWPTYDRLAAELEAAQAARCGVLNARPTFQRMIAGRPRA